jgi:protein-L-isoaspartate(D-aspartate) O-methyltransferase
VPRHLFVPGPERIFAYADQPLPIGYGQTISQPYIVACMTELLDPKPGEVVLEVGSGCGYQAAILSRLAKWVYTVERVSELAKQAEANLLDNGFSNVTCRVGDGTLGWEEVGPFDCIIATASGPEVPPPLKEQLARGGRLVMPVGRLYGGQVIVRVTRVDDDRFETEELLDVAFVPLIGAYGWGDLSR